MAEKRDSYVYIDSKGKKTSYSCSNPIEYRGYLIYKRADYAEVWACPGVFNYGGKTKSEFAGWNWDVVKDGICLTMRAGENGARRAIDELLQEGAANVG